MNGIAKEKYLERLHREIRTSMNSMLGLAELMWETPLDTRQREYVEMFRVSADRLLGVSDGIAELSGSQSTVPKQRDWFDVRETVKQTADLMSLLGADRGLTVAATVQADVPARVTGERSRIEEVLVTLLRNAIRFSEQGEVSVEVSSDRGVGDELSLLFQVRDNGIGIPADKLEGIFSAFDASPSDRSEERKGLGLAVAKLRVDAMGGAIQVQSEIGAGSTFSFCVPVRLAAADAKSPAQATQPAAGPRPGLRILVAEDSRDNLFLMQAFLRDQTAEIDSAENGGIALEKLKHNHYDLVLMDVEMPILNGYDVVRQLRAWELEQDASPTPVICLTARTGSEEILKSQQAGCTAYVSKPVRKQALLQAVAKHAAVTTQ